MTAEERRERLGARVRRLRMDSHWKQADLAVRLGCDQRQVSRLERGESSVSLDAVCELARLFDCSPAHLIRGIR